MQLAVPGTLANYQADVTDASAMEAMAEDFIGRFGAPDLVIANAGDARRRPRHPRRDRRLPRVNRFRMPFLLSEDDAAARIARAIAARRRLAVIPVGTAARAAGMALRPAGGEGAAQAARRQGLGLAIRVIA